MRNLFYEESTKLRSENFKAKNRFGTFSGNKSVWKGVAMDGKGWPWTP
jgi:hypothetical protein